MQFKFLLNHLPVYRAFRNSAEMAEYGDSSCAAIPAGRPMFY